MNTFVYMGTKKNGVIVTRLRNPQRKEELEKLAALRKWSLNLFMNELIEKAIKQAKKPYKTL